MVRINKKKLDDAIQDHETGESVNEEKCGDSCSCSNPSSCGIDKRHKNNWQQDT